METWIKLFRKIETWEWYQDANTFRLFVHCLVKANYNGNKWQGEVLHRGSFPTSPEKLGAELGLSRQQIRTSINKLKSTNEITTKSTNKFTIISIVNYESYQDAEIGINQRNNHQINQQITNKQPTNNQQITTLKEVKKERSKERNIIAEIILYLNDKTGKQFKQNTPATIFKIEARLKEGFTFEDFKKVIDNKIGWIEDPKMQEYLRPETLFGTKFESYLNAEIKDQPVKNANDPWTPEMLAKIGVKE